MKIGKQETMMVIRVDKERRYIDLSKKKVQPEEALQTERHFKKAKMVHNILRQVAIKMDCTLLELYEAFGWDLYDKFGHAYDAFRLIMRYDGVGQLTLLYYSDHESVFKEIDITEAMKPVLIESIAKKMAPSAIKLRADFELKCFTYEGIDALRETLLTAKKTVNDEHF
jgi:translation initiation factor 2 subunit 1